MMSKLCPCHSGKEYSNCCKPYHEGKTNPQNASQLMRSRYSAYALQLADYIIKTTHPKNISYQKDFKKWSESILHFCKITTFKDLKVEDFKETSETEAYVTFTAYLMQAGHDASFREKSRFEKVDGLWLYLEKV